MGPESQHLFTRAFRDPALEEAYLDYAAARVRRAYRIVLPIGFLVYAASSAMEAWGVSPAIQWLGDAGNLHALSMLRFVLALPLMAAVAAFGWAPFRLFRDHWARAYAGAGFALVVVPALSVSWMPAPERVDVGVAFISIVAVLVSGCLILPVRFVNASALIAVSAAVTVHNAMVLPHTPATGWYFFACAVAVFGAFQVEAADRHAFLQERALHTERARSDRLLLNVLPGPIAERLKHEASAIAERFDAVTVLFADIVGFTPLSARMPPLELVHLLNEIFSTFDEIARRHGLEKIKTIGDAYMVVGGVPEPRDDHAIAVAHMALEMRDAVAKLGEGSVALRIGMHTGPVVAGVIGTAKFSYDLWGDTVNTASRMESHGEPGRIQITDPCRAALGDAFDVNPRGVVDVKGKGPTATWWLEGGASARFRAAPANPIS